MPLNGVRNTAMPTGARSGTDGMERAMTVSLRQSVELVSDPRNLDASVEEVFQTMLGVHCKRVSPGVSLARTESVTAVVGFGGLLSGACVFRAASAGGMRIAALMTGMDFQDVDDTVKDAVGEVCNMLAGTWKGKVPELAAHCALSVPAVITGHDYSLHVQAPEFSLNHHFSFEDVHFEVMIVCDGLQ